MVAERTYSLGSALGLPDAEEDVGSSGDFGDDALS